MVEVAQALVVYKHQGKVEEVGADANHTEVVEHIKKDVGQVERSSNGDKRRAHQSDGCQVVVKETYEEEPGLTSLRQFDRNAVISRDLIVNT